MITEDYVSFETAKLLKDKGFNEPCEKSYYMEGFDNPMVFSHDLFPIMQNDEYLCPTLQMAMKWLREEKDLIVNIWWSNSEDTAWCTQYLAPIPSNPKLNYFVLIGEGYKTYEEACEASIKYCLENLL